MTSAKHDVVPQDLLWRLVCSLAPERVFLFGSRARGLGSGASDIDLLLVGAWRMDAANLLRHARHLSMHQFPRVDLVLCTVEEADAAEAGHAPFLRSILESGVLIYQRRPAILASRAGEERDGSSPPALSEPFTWSSKRGTYQRT